MSTNNDLKDRFKRLQKMEQSVPEATVVKKTESVVTPQVEVVSSHNTSIHQAIMNCTQTESFDWKKTYRNKFQRPALIETLNPVIQETQWKIQALLQQPLLVSFHHTPCLSGALKKLNFYIVSRPTFWSQLMAGVGQLHIRSAKNKIQVWMRFNDQASIGNKRVKEILENEFLTNSKQLKAFSLQKVEEWFEISFEINEKPVDIRDKEASV